jgi:F-type H+-transporting ATPase subunit gamma
MPSLKEYKAKLVSLKNTRKLTKAMKMVAASKLFKTMDAQRKASLYAQRLNEMIARLAASVDSSDHPLLAERKPQRNALVLVITSDKGLCGGFNNNLIKYVSRWIARPPRKYEGIKLSFCGRRGYSFFRSRAKVQTFFDGVTAKPAFADAIRISRELTDQFVSGQVDEVFLAYSSFINPISQKPTIERLLPLGAIQARPGERAINENYIFEPAQREMLSILLPKTVEFAVYFALLENAAGENGARMTAMDSATNNAGSLIDLYTLLRNRARQASITKELIEIISGAEALKG